MNRLLALACAVLASVAGTVLAQDYPARSVRIVVPFAAGATNDIVARLVAHKLSEQTRQPFVVENRVGGNGIIGAEFVAKSPPDGYTLLLGNTSSLAIQISLFAKLPYHPQRDFDVAAIVAESPTVLVIHPSVPARTVEEFVAHAKANPGRLNYASPGNGTPFHLAMELFKTQTGTQLVHVPYKGAAPAVADLLTGQVQAIFDNTPNILPHVRSGKLRALAAASTARLAVLPDVPTMGEAGLRGVEATSFFAIVAPKGTPPRIIGFLNSEIGRAVRESDVRQKLAEFGAEPVGNTPQQSTDYVAREIARWAQVVKASGAKVDD